MAQAADCDGQICNIAPDIAHNDNHGRYLPLVPDEIDN